MGKLFYLEVGRCKRCGGILISEKSKKRGYGESCYKRTMIEKKNNEDPKRECKAYPQQATIFDYLK